MHHVFLKNLTKHNWCNWQKQVHYFALAKYWQNIDNKYNALVTIGKSLVEINMRKF